MSSNNLFKIVTYEVFDYKFIYLKVLALNNPQELICCKTPHTNQPTRLKTHLK